MFRLIREVRFATRTLVRARFVTSLAVLAFALGIGVKIGRASCRERV